MYTFALDFLYKKKKKLFHEDIPILRVVKMYENDLDKEIVIMLQAIMNESSYHTGGTSALLGIISPLTPSEWIKSESPMLVFTSQTYNRFIGNTKRLGQIIKPIERLVDLYREYDDLKDFIKRNRSVCPQEDLMKWLFGATDDFYHLGLARYLPILSRRGDSAGLGLINRIPHKNLYIPRTKKVERSGLNVRMFKKTEKKPFEVIREKLVELDKEDPFKYMPILDNKNPTLVINQMGYLIHYY